MKRVKLFALFVVIILVFGFSFLYFKIEDVIEHPLITSNEKIKIEVVKGDTFFVLANKLEKDNIIKNSNLLKLAVKYKKITTDIKVGQYEVDNDVSLTELLNVLDSGVSINDSIKVTIPEGYDIEGIANLIEEKGLVSKSEFLDALLNYPLPDYINENDKLKYNLEGYLFPDTYEFKIESTANEIIDKMILNFNNVIGEYEEKTGKKIKNLNEIITMASIVEKEAQKSEEREIVASVFNNRIDDKMKLQSCATVLYALGEYKEKLLLKDLEVDSIYNTYKNLGLTPGPICNPGKASILAALNPAETDFIYFVAKGDGSHYFTDNYKEFINAKNKYLK